MSRTAGRRRVTDWMTRPTFTNSRKSCDASVWRTASLDLRLLYEPASAASRFASASGDRDSRRWLKSSVTSRPLESVSPFGASRGWYGRHQSPLVAALIDTYADSEARRRWARLSIPSDRCLTDPPSRADSQDAHSSP